jgi:short-subunit dehydrogenase
MKRLLNKRVYITGGSSGIGLETAKQVYAQGAQVVLIARNKDKLHQASRELEAIKKNRTQRVTIAVLDVADNAAVAARLPDLMEECGAPDVLVACAGIGYGDYFENISYQTFDQVIRTNLYGVRNIIEACLPKMKVNRGTIVIVSSLAGLTGMIGYSAYSASKFALVGFAESIRPEFKRLGIRVVLVCPPEVQTPLIEEEAKTLPPEARAIKNMAGLLTAEAAAKAILKAIVGNRFLYIPGIKSKLSYLLVRLLPGFLVRATTDAIISVTAKHKRT